MGGEPRRKKGRGGQFKGREALRQGNRQVDAIVKKLQLSYDQRRELHDMISGQDHSYSQVLDIAKKAFGGADE
jgi:hypothetical protein